MGPKIPKISSGAKLKLFGTDLANLEGILVPENVLGGPEGSLGGPWRVLGGPWRVPGGSLGVPGGS